MAENVNRSAEELAKRVAHDLRNPLAALNCVVGSLSALPQDEQEIISVSIQRIREIANNLSTYHWPSPPESSVPLFIDGKSSVAVLIEEVVREKQKQFRMMNELIISSSLDSTITSVAQASDAPVLLAKIANTINEAVEQLGGVGQVKVRLEAGKNHGSFHIEVLSQNKDQNIRTPIIS